MPINTRELIEAVSIVADNHDIRVTVKSSFKASCIVAGTTFAGGVVLGPLGIPIGATVGGLYAYKHTKGTFKSAALVIKEELTEEQQDRLCQHIVDAFKDIRAEDIALLIPLLMSPGQFQSVAMAKVVSFLRDEMNMRLTT